MLSISREELKKKTTKTRKKWTNISSLVCELLFEGHCNPVGLIQRCSVGLSLSLLVQPLGWTCAVSLDATVLTPHSPTECHTYTHTRICTVTHVTQDIHPHRRVLALERRAERGRSVSGEWGGLRGGGSLSRWRFHRPSIRALTAPVFIPRLV